MILLQDVKSWTGADVGSGSKQEISGTISPGHSGMGMIGQTISHYRITEKLGEGRMDLVLQGRKTRSSAGGQRVIVATPPAEAGESLGTIRVVQNWYEQFRGRAELCPRKELYSARPRIANGKSPSHQQTMKRG